jgi:hypothetical protein
MNDYTTFSERTVATLAEALPPLGWDPLDVRKGIWKPRNLAPFDRYLVYVAPPLDNPWTERRLSTKEMAYILTAHVFLLVKNYNEEQSIYGDEAPALGVFQFISDVKGVLRDTDLGGFLDRTYNETVGGTRFESGAADGFDTGGHGWVHRAMLTYTVQTAPFCPPT